MCFYKYSNLTHYFPSKIGYIKKHHFLKHKKTIEISEEPRKATFASSKRKKKNKKQTI